MSFQMLTTIIISKNILKNDKVYVQDDKNKLKSDTLVEREMTEDLHLS